MAYGLLMHATSASPDTAAGRDLGGLIFVISCYTFPYVFVLVANALDRIPGDLEDASSILGGRALVTARRVTIPLALPALLAGALVAFLQAMTLFGSPAILAMPAGFHTMTTKIWSLFQYPPKPELAAAASVPLLVLTVLLLRAEATILYPDVDTVAFKYFGTESDIEQPRWYDEWKFAKMPTMIRMLVVTPDGMQQPETMVRLMLGEEAGCLENSFQRSCRPRRP